MPPGLQRQQEQGGLIQRSEPGHHRVPLLLRRAAVQEEHRAAEPGGQVRLQHPAELGVLREAQRLVALGHDLVADLLEPGQLAGPARQPGTVAEQVGGMVAHLLELGHRGQHQAAAADVVGRVLDAAEHVGDRGRVQARLLGGEVAPDLHLLLVRQVGDDRLVGLQAAEHERLGERASAPAPRPREPCRSIGIAYFSRNFSAGPSRPGLVNSMIDHSSDSRFSTGVPVSAILAAAGSPRTARACLVA